MLSGSQNVNMAFMEYRFIGTVLLSTTCACTSLPTMHLLKPETHSHRIFVKTNIRPLKTDIPDRTVFRVQHLNIRPSYLTVLTFNVCHTFVNV